jgi:hypothetical protein
MVDGVPAPYLRPVSDEAWSPVKSEHALISPPAAAAGAVDALAEGEADGEVLALADATADAATLADADAVGDADRFGLSESAWVSVAGGLLAGVRAEECELLLHADAVKARTAMLTVAARVFSRMRAPGRRRNGTSRMPEANPPPVTAA